MAVHVLCLFPVHLHSSACTHAMGFSPNVVDNSQVMQASHYSDLFDRNDVQMANERLLQLLSDVVQSNIQTENRISHRLTALVSQSAGRSPRNETGGDDGGHARDTLDGKGSGDDGAAGGIALISLRLYN